MVVQSHILILSEWAIWCAKERVCCTLTPKTRCNLSSKEHQCRALTAAWKEQGRASLTVGAPSKPFLQFPFFHFWHHKIHFNLTLLDVWWALISLRSLCFRNVPILLWYFTLCDLAKRKRMGTYSTASEMQYFYGVIPTEHLLLWTVENSIFNVYNGKGDGNFLRGDLKNFHFTIIFENGSKVQYLKQRKVLFYLSSFGIKS